MIQKLFVAVQKRKGKNIIPNQVAKQQKKEEEKKEAICSFLYVSAAINIVISFFI